MEFLKLVAITWKYSGNISCLFVCVPEQVLVSTCIILLNAALSISYLVSLTVFITEIVCNPD